MRKLNTAMDEGVEVGDIIMGIEAPITKIMGKALKDLEANKTNEKNEWSREGCYNQMERGLNEGCGLYPPPHVLPYKPIGLVDVERGRSLLPETYKFYKGGPKPSPRQEQPDEETPPITTSSVTLPLTLKNTFWNGERWCSAEFSARTAKVLNGFELLQVELKQSEEHLHNVRMGRFFLDGIRVDEAQTGNPLCSSKRSHSEFHPYIPPLPLSDIPRYNIEEQLADNKMLLALYHDEAKLSQLSARSPTTTRSVQIGSGLPPKACEEHSLKQLEKIMDKGTKFDALKAECNSRLLTELVTVKSTRCYTFQRVYSGLKGLPSARRVVYDLNATPRATTRFRQTLLKLPWFEVLIDLAYMKGRRPSRGELFIIDHIRALAQRTGKFDANNFGDLMRILQYKEINMDKLGVRRALHYVKEALHLSDDQLLTYLLRLPDSKLPQWLQAHKSLLNMVKRKLSPRSFPTCQIMALSRSTASESPLSVRSLNDSTRSTTSSLSKKSTKFLGSIQSTSLPLFR